MFKGHQFIKICNDNWVFDLTEYIGYKVKLDEDGNVESYKQAYQVIQVENELTFEKFTRVPLKIFKETVNVINEYNEEIGIKWI